jgi:ferredoxin-type protein NapF
MVLPAHPGRRGIPLGRPAIADDRPVRSVAAIAWSCLALHGVACMTCRDACLTEAIRFFLVRGGAIPRIETEACMGCADCVPVCPASTITIAPRAAEVPTGA